MSKLRKREKIFFAGADFYGGGAQALIGVVYYVFLTLILGLSPIYASAIVGICEVWDAISDPLMGLIGDNFRSKFGRRRPFIFVGGILLVAAFALLLMPFKVPGDNELVIFGIALAINLFYNTVSTIILVSYNSLSAEISNDPAERDKANVLRLVISTVATAICTLVPGIILDMYKDGKLEINQFYLIIGVLFAFLFGIPVILCGLFCKERTEIPEEKNKFDVKSFVAPLRVKPFRQLLVMYLSQAICMDIFAAGVVFFAKFVTEPKGSSTVFLGIFIAVQLLAFPIVNKLVKNTNTNKIYGRLLPIAITAMTVFAIFGQHLYVGYACIFFVAVGFAGAQLTSWIMYPHTVDSGELLLGKRNSGSYSALMTFARKLSNAIAINLFGIVLEFTGFNEKLDVQTPSAQNGIKYVMGITCIVFMLIGYFVSRKYILTKNVEKKVEKYLPYERENKIDELSEEDKLEYDSLINELK